MNLYLTLDMSTANAKDWEGFPWSPLAPTEGGLEYSSMTFNPWIGLLATTTIRGVSKWLSGRGAPLVAQTVKNLPTMQETQVQFLVWEDHLEKGMATHSGILAWKIRGCKELDTTEWLTLSLPFSGKDSACQCNRCRRHGSVSGLRRSPERGNGKPLQYSCLDNPMDRGPWWSVGSRRVQHNWAHEQQKWPSGYRAVLSPETLPWNSFEVTPSPQP